MIHLKPEDISEKVFQKMKVIEKDVIKITKTFADAVEGLENLTEIVADFDKYSLSVRLSVYVRMDYLLANVHDPNSAVGALLRLFMKDLVDSIKRTEGEEGAQKALAQVEKVKEEFKKIKEGFPEEERGNIDFPGFVLTKSDSEDPPCLLN